MELVHSIHNDRRGPTLIAMENGLEHVFSYSKTRMLISMQVKQMVVHGKRSMADGDTMNDADAQFLNRYH